VCQSELTGARVKGKHMRFADSLSDKQRINRSKFALHMTLSLWRRFAHASSLTGLVRAWRQARVSRRLAGSRRQTVIAAKPLQRRVVLAVTVSHRSLHNCLDEDGIRLRQHNERSSLTLLTQTRHHLYTVLTVHRYRHHAAIIINIFSSQTSYH
jgi:hypothetical protein